MKMSYLRDNKGYTLTELLVAIVCGFLLITAASATYISQNRAFVTQESVSETNTQSKIAHDMIADDTKSAGFGTTNDLSSNAVNGFNNIITPVDSAVATDAVTIVSGRMVGQLWPVGVGPGMIACPAAPPPVTIPAGTSQVDVVYSGTGTLNNSDKRFISIDGIEDAVVASTSIIGYTITLTSNLSKAFPLLDTDGDGMCDTGRPVYLIEDTTFCVDANSALRRIRRNANVAACTGIATSDNDAIAEHIEDLQLAYAVDANNDGDVDDLNGNGMIDGGDFINGALVGNFDDIRAIRINVLAMTDKRDVNFRGLGNPPATVENRAHIQTNDDFRRRWWQSIVKIRNQ
jgi:Tfp pilus assembly protein PilW